MTFPLVVCVALAAGAACQRDPSATARAFVASGDQHVAAGRLEAGVLEYRNALEHEQSPDTYYKLGLAYERLRQLEKAFEAFVRVTELDETNTDANLRVAEMLLASERYEGAEQLANRIIVREPGHVRALSIAAVALDARGQSVEAKRRLNQALEADPRSTAALVAQASWQLRRGDVKPAADTLRRAVTYDAQSVQAWTALAQAEWRLGQIGRAETAFQKVLALSPDEAGARRQLSSFYLRTERPALAEPHLRALAETSAADKLALADYFLASNSDAAAPLLETLTLDRDKEIAAQARLRRAVLARSAGASKEAHADIDLAMRHSTAEPQALLLKAELLAEEGQRDAALDHARKAQALKPRWSEASYALAMIHLARGDLPEAERELKRAREQGSPPALVDTELARIALSRGDVRAASTLAKHAIASESTASAYTLLSQAHRAAGNLNEARRAIAIARKKWPDDGQAAIVSAQLELMQGRRDRAEQILADAARRSPRDAFVAESLAQVYLSLGKRERALQTYAKVSELRPASVEALTVVGMLKQESGDRAGASAAYERVLQLSPDAGIAANNLAWLYAEDNRLDEAARVAERAVASLGHSAQALNTLGWVYYRQKRYEAAVDLLSQAVSKAPGNSLYRHHLDLSKAERSQN